MKQLTWVLVSFLSCSVPLFSQVDPATYERAMISGGDNRPDFDTNDQSIKALIISLHLHVAPEEFQKRHGWTSEEYLQNIRFLISKNYAYEKGGTFFPSCMVIPDQKGRDLLRHAEPVSQAIAQAIISSLDDVRNLYEKTDLCRAASFDSVAFLILSNVLLDNWQISNVEAEFLGKERPLRHGRNYYFAFLQNLNPPKEAFGLYGNWGISRDISVYGNNRKALSTSQIQEQSKRALIVTAIDRAIFDDMAALFKPILIGILKNQRGHIEEVYAKTGYDKEVSFEEFFIWWYHFIYTRTTDLLAEKGHLTIPEGGNLFYGSAPASDKPATAKGVE